MIEEVVDEMFKRTVVEQGRPLLQVARLGSEGKGVVIRTELFEQQNEVLEVVSDEETT